MARKRLASHHVSVAASKPPHCSRVTNGSPYVLDGVDGRSQLARRFRDLISAISADLGGMVMLTELQRQLIKRAATLSLHCEVLDTRMAAGETIDLESYGRAANTLRRLTVTLGLSRAQGFGHTAIDQSRSVVVLPSNGRE